MLEHKQVRCQGCGRLYVAGSQRLCRACQRARAQQRRRRRSPHRRVFCDCGKVAVEVVEVRVGLDGVYRERMPLCADCLRLEREMEA